jgi:protein pelota
MKQQRIAKETEIVEEILKRIGKGESNVTYGFDEVKKSAELGAVEKLVLTDIMLREAPDEKRLIIEDLMKSVERKGGNITVISTEHEAGVKLMALGGIAALLRYALH